MHVHLVKTLNIGVALLNNIQHLVCHIAMCFIYKYIYKYINTENDEEH